MKYRFKIGDKIKTDNKSYIYNEFTIIEIHNGVYFHDSSIVKAGFESNLVDKHFYLVNPKKETFIKQLEVILETK